MRSFRRAVIILALAATTFGLAFSTSPARAESSYDGVWNVTIHTQTGSCEPTASYPLTVTDGVVSAGGADISGKVGSSGIVRVSIRGVYANGKLNAKRGSGKWNGASGGVPCSGRWVAARQ